MLINLNYAAAEVFIFYQNNFLSVDQLRHSRGFPRRASHFATSFGVDTNGTLSDFCAYWE